MARGNQRDLAREKNLKKQQKQKAGTGSGGVEMAKKNLSNAEIMRQKQAKADTLRAEQENKALQEKKEAKAKKPDLESS